MAKKEKFRISSALKDIIGRDLITNEFVAIFELVKNSFDAHATRVDIEFDKDSITIIDDGKGMSEEDILEKWLFVAYSAKRLDKEDEDLSQDFRNKISVRRGYAGSKGIGRFSCDRLGSTLNLYSRSANQSQVQHLEVDWTFFEKDAEKEFATIDVELSSTSAFPKPKKALKPKRHGTMLIIKDLRQEWLEEKIERLRSYLAKLVNPFAPTSSIVISTFVTSQNWPNAEGVVGNDIADVLNEKTTRIEVAIKGGLIVSSLIDRGRLIYKIEEDNPYEQLKGATISTSVYYLNRSAKATFSRRQGIQPVRFGHLFLFLNGFRVMPYGEETDDTLGIARRKQQGTSRYLGLRDIIGKVEIEAPPRMFQEASSRDAGLIEDERTYQLYDALRRSVIFRLERYVTGVSWKDKLDKDRDDSSGLHSDAAKTRIIKIVKALVGSKKVRLIDYDQELVDVINERATQFEEAMLGLISIAEEKGDKKLLDRIERSRARFEELKKAEKEAIEAAERESAARIEADERADKADQRAARLETQTKLLSSAQGKVSEQLMLFHHQSIIYAAEVESLVRTSLTKLQAAEKIFSDKYSGTKDSELVSGSMADVVSNLQGIALQNSRILAVTRFATQADFDMDADWITADIVQFMSEYISEIASAFEDPDFINFFDHDLSMKSTFRPVDISIAMDNLISNARKARATKITFSCEKVSKGAGVQVIVSDDGRGIDDQKIDPARIFDKGYTGTRRGSGLGLYHARHVMDEMGGGLGLDPDREGREARFIVNLPKA